MRLEQLNAGGVDGEIEKLAFWRRLRPEHTGHDEGGNEVAGKTWIGGKLKPDVTPKAHQVDALKTIARLKPGSGLVLAHGTGTGKTPTAVMAVEQYRQQHGGARALVVAPAGLRQNFHEKGVQRFTTATSQIAERPSQVRPDSDYVVVSYEAFRQRPEAFIQAVKPDVVVADEFHRAANPQSKTHQAIKQVRGEIPEFLGLTASIAQNDPSDMAPLLALARGEDISKDKFRARHVRRVDTGKKGIFGGKITKPELKNAQDLSELVGRSVHYVEDLDASEKPTKHVETVEVPMSKEQLAVYDLTLKGIDPRLRDKMTFGGLISERDRQNLLTRILLARKASNSLHTVTNMTVDQAAEATPKVRRLLGDVSEHLAQTDDGQVIVYTNFVRGGVDVISAGLQARGIPYGVFAGKSVPGMTEAARQQAVDNYLKGQSRVIIITGAGAEGLSLGNTTMVAMLDGSYNPERNAQAEARGVRAGGLAHRPIEQRKVEVRRYVSTVPRNFWQTVTLRPRQTSVDQFVYGTAQRKAEANRTLRDVLQGQSQHESKRRDNVFYRFFGSRP